MFPGRLPTSAEDTAEFLLRLNNSLDVLNSSTHYSPCALKTAITQNNIDERRRLLKEDAEWLRMWNVQVPSVRGLQQTMAGILVIWDRFGGGALPFLMTRRLNQDGLENLFGVLRMSCGQNDTPNPTQFRMALRKCVTSSLMMAPKTANCEPDSDALLTALTAATRKSCTRPPSQVSTPSPVIVAPVDSPDCVDENVLTYVGGYLLRRGCEKHSCARCNQLLCKPEKLVVYQREILCGLRSVTGLTDVDVGSLFKPTQAWYDAVVETYQVAQSMAPALLCQPELIKRLEPHVMVSPAVTDLLLGLCEQNALKYMVRVFLRMQIHMLCIKAVPSMGRKAPGNVNRKSLKLACRVPVHVRQ